MVATPTLSLPSRLPRIFPRPTPLPGVPRFGAG
jgi:hypothetical protein